MPRAPWSPASDSWRVQRWHDLPSVQARARRFLEAGGLDTHGQWCVMIALTEAATNALKFASGGHISLEIRLEHTAGSPPGVVLQVVDDGPGIPDPRRALEDFYSEGSDWRAGPFVARRRGNGTGLGSIRRLMDDVQLENRAEGGLRLVAVKHLELDTPNHRKERS